MLNDWPTNLRHDKDSIRLYQELLNRVDVLKIPMLCVRVHRDGPSLLTVKPKNLVRQWMTPLPGLDLRPHMPSTFVRSDSFMKDVKDAMLKGDTDALLDLYVTHYMTKNRLNDRHDAQKIMK
ncbi:hypothetical protein COOONC_15838, partial [Cooperia oncophora]